MRLYDCPQCGSTAITYLDDEETRRCTTCGSEVVLQ